MPNLRQQRLFYRLAIHHVPLLAASSVVVYALYTTRPFRDPITRASFATAYPALLLLAITLWIGPWNIFFRRRTPVSSDLRRDIGIWAGILGVIHAVIGLNVHLRGHPWLYFFYRKSEGPHLLPFRHDLFGFANYTGLAATILLVLLFATSNDAALRKLGTPGWKKLQRWNYPLFALAIAHTLGYQLGVESQHVPWVVLAIACAAISIGLQLAGYWMRRSRKSISSQKSGVTISI